MEESALDVLTVIAGETSLRYAIQLITTSNLVARRRKVLQEYYLLSCTSIVQIQFRSLHSILVFCMSSTVLYLIHSSVTC